MNLNYKENTIIPEIFSLIIEQKNIEAKEYVDLNPNSIFDKDNNNETPLHIACMSANFEMVQYLVENGGKVNAYQIEKYATSLNWLNNNKISNFLIDHNAIIQSNELLDATRENNIEVVNQLLQNGAVIDNINPQYLICQSIDCLKVYVKHNININGTDQNKSNLLHIFAWRELPLMFDYAYENGCLWQKDSSQRTPYYLAKQGNREKIIKHFKNKYSDQISHKIEICPIEDYNFERILFLEQNPAKPDCFIALTTNLKLIRYLLFENKLIIELIVKLDVSTIRNFSFDKKGNLIIPTADNKLLLLDNITFQLIKTVEIDENTIIDQITYLPSKKIFICSSQNWEVVLLSEDFKFISRTKTKKGTILPKINRDESLFSFLSYDQETFYDLYSLNDDLSISFIHSFSKDWKNLSRGFSFNNDEMIVSFADVIECFLYNNATLKKSWEIDMSAYNSEHNLSYLTSINENIIIVGKGKKLLHIDKSKKVIIQEKEVDLLAEIRDLYVDRAKEYLFIVTDKELKTINVIEKNGGITKS
jgi:ankyrin repeat protein